MSFNLFLSHMHELYTHHSLIHLVGALTVDKVEEIQHNSRSSASPENAANSLNVRVKDLITFLFE